MKLCENHSLKNFNTFGVDVRSHYFCSLKSRDQLPQLAKLPMPKLYLGGGSNMLFTKDYPGTVIHNALTGIEVISESSDSVLVKVAAGEIWHNFVCVMNERGYYGLEYLALIPGTVGAAPVQNIGAYGAEVRDYIESVEVFDSVNNEILSFTNSDCDFGYRHSFFKENPSRYLILSVTFKLSKKPMLSVTYKALLDFFEKESKAVDSLDPKDILNAVIQIRAEKLPDPKVLGNSGSFFKNPIVDISKADLLKKTFPNLVTYPVSNTKVKLAAGQLIDLAGLKGVREGNVGMHKNQALVLVNYGGASGDELWKYAQKVQLVVKSLFSIDLEPEPLIL